MTRHTLGSTRVLDSYSSPTRNFRFGFVRFSLKDVETLHNLPLDIPYNDASPILVRARTAPIKSSGRGRVACEIWCGSGRMNQFVISNGGSIQRYRWLQRQEWWTRLNEVLKGWREIRAHREGGVCAAATWLGDRGLDEPRPPGADGGTGHRAQVATPLRIVEDFAPAE